MEVAPRDARRLRGSRHVSAVRCEDALEVTALELVDDELPCVGDREIEGKDAIDGIADGALGLR